jgi:shikimate dehydrogenase
MILYLKGFSKCKGLKDVSDFLTFGYFEQNNSGSISTQIINALFDELKINAVYLPYQAEEKRFLDALSMLRSKFDGFNVSDSYMTIIAAYMDKIDLSARESGVVNTVKIEKGKLTGYDTESAGFLRGLYGLVDNLKLKPVLLLGAGGPAYSAADILLKAGAVLSIYADNAVMVRMLADKLTQSHNARRIKAVKEISGEDEFLLIVNAAEPSKSDKYVSAVPDKVYSKVKYAYDFTVGMTPLLKKASDNGAVTKDGFDIIFFRSLETVKIWAGITEISDEIVSKIYNKARIEYINLL